MRTNATQFFGQAEALKELDEISFAFSALVDTLPLGSFQRENAANAARGVRSRIDYLHDSFSRLLNKP